MAALQCRLKITLVSSDWLGKVEFPSTLEIGWSGGNIRLEMEMKSVTSRVLYQARSQGTGSGTGIERSPAPTAPFFSFPLSVLELLTAGSGSSRPSS